MKSSTNCIPAVPCRRNTQQPPIHIFWFTIGAPGDIRIPDGDCDDDLRMPARVSGADLQLLLQAALASAQAEVKDAGRHRAQELITEYVTCGKAIHGILFYSDGLPSHAGCKSLLTLNSDAYNLLRATVITYDS